MTKSAAISDFTLSARCGAREINLPWTATIPDLLWVDSEITAVVMAWTEQGQLQWRLSEITPDVVSGVELQAFRRRQPGIRGQVFSAAEKALGADNGFNEAVEDAAAEEGLFEGMAA